MSTIVRTSRRQRQPRERVGRGAYLTVVVALIIATPLALSSAASASGSSLHMKGPTKNKLGVNFTYVMSGDAVGTNVYLVAWEQFNQVSGCATTYSAENARQVGSAANKYELSLWTNRSVKGVFSVSAYFGSDHLGFHGLCAYLISGGKTLAHAGQFWDNYS